MKQNPASARPTASGQRLHIVLIPGFAGFDALGQLEYYAGVTPLFRKWQIDTDPGRPAVLHYFDNFPTAGVKTRSERLRRFLSKRVTRGEFQSGDSVALVGHSTGGLDIRRLLWDLALDPHAKLPADGTQDVDAGEVLALIKGVVFLSVPHWGTNIAHWVRDNLLGRTAVVAHLRTSVAASQVPVVNRIQDLVSAVAAYAFDLDLLRAVDDALREAHSNICDTPEQTAYAHESAAQLELWLRHIARDFSAIDDLIPPGSEYACGHRSPAQFTADMRDAEIRQWREHDIAIRSHATVSPRPFRFESGNPAPAWEWLKPWTWPNLTPGTAASSQTDLTYRYCYRACAGGPFQYPKELLPPGLELWDNDGIVNTASMLWPSPEETIIVRCDHEDITGHFREVKANTGEAARTYRAYDLLGSGSSFDSTEFAKVWNQIFDFCASSDISAPASASLAAV